jgi:hypothetical protein
MLILKAICWSVCTNNATGWIKPSSMTLRNSTLRSSTLWNVMQSMFGSLLPTFRDNLSVSSSRIRQPWTLRSVPEERNVIYILAEACKHAYCKLRNFELPFENWSRQPETRTATFHIQNIWGSDSGGKWVRSLCTSGFWIESELMIQELSFIHRKSQFIPSKYE